MSLRILGVSLFAVIVSVFSLSSLIAGDPEPKLLWPNDAPGAKGEKDEDKPSITIYQPAADKNVGSAIVICPGGGYGHLAMDHEGSDVAKWFNQRGITGIVLKYRLGGKGGTYAHPARCSTRNARCAWPVPWRRNRNVMSKKSA